ncbi:MAG: hypothetical protein EBU92_14660 [Betaproteobacteria bacterium]|nr:hypothetical protein [Betaproteobacteria bacterium]
MPVKFKLGDQSYKKSFQSVPPFKEYWYDIPGVADVNVNDELSAHRPPAYGAPVTTVGVAGISVSPGVVVDPNVRLRFVELLPTIVPPFRFKTVPDGTETAPSSLVDVT